MEYGKDDMIAARRLQKKKKASSSESNISDEKWSAMQKKETDEVYSSEDKKAIASTEKEMNKKAPNAVNISASSKPKPLRDSLKVEQPEETTGPIVNDIPDPTVERKVQQERAGAETLGGLAKEYPNALVGMAPLLMGALMGDIGLGAEVAGDTLLSKEKREWDADVANRKLAGKDGNTKGTYQWKTYEAPDGTMRTYRANTATGETEEQDRLAGFSPSVSVDPLTGELARISKNANTVSRSVNPSGKYTIKQQKDIKDMNTALRGDKVFMGHKTAIDSAGRALALLASNNPISHKAIQTIMPRMMGEVGNLTAAEQAAFGGSPTFSRKLEAYKRKFADDGQFTEDDREDLMEVATVMRNYSKARMSQMANQYLDSTSASAGFRADDTVAPFLRNNQVDSQSIAKESKKELPSYGKPSEVVQEGRRYRIDANGEYQFVDFVGKGSN